MPQIREEFGLSTALVSLIASGAYVGYSAALCAVGLIASRVGPRPPVVVGGLSAAAGMALVAWSQGTLALTAGVILAATSAGWSWPPYNDAAERVVPPRLQARVLSIVSTETTYGIAAAGLAALAAGETWRAGWLVFAVAALIALVCNAAILPAKGGDTGGGAGYWPGGRWFFGAGVAPLFAVAASFGVVSSVYWSFAVDHVSRNGDLRLPLEVPVGPLLFVVVGLGGIAGFFTGGAIRRFGLRTALRAILFSAALATSLLSIAPGSWPVVVLSAVLFGAYVMTISALISVWSSLVFPGRPSTGFSAALIAFAIGSILAPASMGLPAGTYGYGVVFLLSGTVAALTMFVRPTEGRSKR